jgi:hypothetical protein
VDLSAYFATARARSLVVAAGVAPLRGALGTLRNAVGIVPPRAGELAKSGTDGRENLLTYAKTAAGARDGVSWFTRVAAGRGPVGSSHVSILPLVRLVRERALVRTGAGRASPLLCDSPGQIGCRKLAIP